MASVWLHPLGMSQLRNSPGISTGFLRHGRSRILTNKAIAYGSGRGDVLAALHEAAGCRAYRDVALGLRH